MADDAGIGYQLLKVFVGQHGTATDIKVIEDQLEIRPHIVNNAPIETGLKYTFCHHRQPTIVRDCGDISAIGRRRDHCAQFGMTAFSRGGNFNDLFQRAHRGPLRLMAAGK
jgi:hypothetical protein